jgi:hypothetical protein
VAICNLRAAECVIKVTGIEHERAALPRAGVARR